jgi:uncharacterized repeat protein (TIGR02543 family)
VTPAVSSYVGFSAPAAPQTVSIDGDGSTVVNYYYARNGYQVTFHPNNGGSETTSTVKYEALLGMPTVTRAGYVFGGWYDSDTFTGAAYTAISTMPAAGLHLYAKWTATTVTYTVQHWQETVGGGLYALFETETLTGTAGDEVAFAIKAYEGFTAPARQSTSTINGDGSTVVRYDYARNSYRVTFHPGNDGSDTTGTFKYEELIALPTLGYAGYTFAGWYDNAGFAGDAYTSTSKMPAHDLELYAKWTQSTTTYKVEHWREIVAGQLYSLFETKTLTGTIGDQVTPTVETYEGFTSPSTQTATIQADGSTVVRYDYQRKSYVVTYHPNNGEADIESTPIRYQATVVPPPVSKEGYTFAGWYQTEDLGGDRYVFSTMPAGDLEVWAKWELVVLYQVDARNDLGATDYIDWGQFGDPYGRNPMSYANPPAQGVKTHNGHDVVVTSESGVRFSVNSQGWSWGMSYGAFAYRDALLHNQASALTSDLASPIYDPLTLDFGAHPVLAAGLQLEPLWHGDYTARIEAYGIAGSSLGSFTISGNSPGGSYNNMEEYYIWGYGNSGSGSNTAAFLGVRSDVPIKKLVLTLLTCGRTRSGAYQLGDFAINRVSLVTAPSVAISQELSTGGQETLSAPAWVNDTVTLTWDGTLPPTGSIVVTGTMPDGHTWEVGSKPIPADATSPFTFKTTDQGLGTGAPWAGGVLTEGLYKFQAKYVPGAGSLFSPAVSAFKQVTVVGWYDGFDSYEPGSDMNGVGGWQEPYVLPGSPPLTVTSDYHRSAPYSLELIPESSTRARTVTHGHSATSGVWKVEMWWYVPGTGVNIQFWLSAPSTGYAFLNGLGSNMYPLGGGVVPIVTGQWVPISFVVDLDSDRQRIYYNNTYMGQYSYLPDTIEFGVQPKAGGSTTYLDDVSIAPTTWPVD